MCKVSCRSKRKNKRSKHVVLVWLEFVPFWFLFQLIRIMPLGLAYMLSSFLFSILFVFDEKHRERVISHLRHAGIGKTSDHARILGEKVFDHFAKLLVEIVKKDQCIKGSMIRIKCEPATYDRIFGEHKSNVILVTAHYGNWELTGSFWAAWSGIPMVSIMRPFDNRLIGSYILRNRESDLHKSVNKKGGIKLLFRALKESKTVAMLVDQHASPKEGGIETVFFGQPCLTYSSPALLHLKTGVPIVPLVTRRLDDQGHFEVIIGDMIDYKATDDKEKDVRAITQMYTQALEKLIAVDPLQWMWAHRRWTNINRAV